MPPSQLRYIVGCDLSAGPSNRQAEEMLTSNGYSIWTFPKCTNAVITEFPFRSQLCCLVGALRVYPALNKYAKVCVCLDSVYVYCSSRYNNILLPYPPENKPPPPPFSAAQTGEGFECVQLASNISPRQQMALLTISSQPI